LPLRAAIARNLLQAANDPQHPLAALAILRELGDRLDGKSTPRTEQREVRQTIIYKAGDPPPWLKSERELVEMGVLPGPPPGSAPEALPSVSAKFEELTNVPVPERSTLLTDRGSARPGDRGRPVDAKRALRAAPCSVVRRVKSPKSLIYRSFR
jgi:hypothetical protein